MKTENRTKHSIRNLFFSILAYMVQIILGFLARRYFIYYFSTEYLGLNSLFSNVISILSLAELGFGTALVFAMYKPMAEGDDEKVRRLLSFYKNCYLVIGLVVLLAGLLVLPFMSFFKSKAPDVDINIYVIYLFTLFNCAVSYLFSYRRSLLYTSQRNDIESKITISIKILLNGFQLLLIVLTKNYYLYVLCNTVFIILDNLIVYLVTKKMFPELVKKPSGKLDIQTKKSINKNVFAMLFHKIGGIVVFGTDSLLIYIFFDSATLGVYSNYLLIVNQIGAFIDIFIGAIRGSVGNSIASETAEHNLNIFRKLNLIFLAVVSFCTACLFCLTGPFITIILNKGSASLLLPTEVLLLICISFFFSQSRKMVCVFRDGAGLFYPSRYSPLFESIVNLVSSILLAKLMGIGGIVLGTILSTVLVPLWVEPYVLNKHYFGQKTTLKYLLKLFFVTIVTAINTTALYFFSTLLPSSNILHLGIMFALCISVSFILTIILFAPFKGYKESLSFIKDIIKSFFKKNKEIA